MALFLMGTIIATEGFDLRFFFSRKLFVEYFQLTRNSVTVKNSIATKHSFDFVITSPRVNPLRMAYCTFKFRSPPQLNFFACMKTMGMSSVFLLLLSLVVCSIFILSSFFRRGQRLKDTVLRHEIGAFCESLGYRPDS